MDLVKNDNSSIRNFRYSLVSQLLAISCSTFLPIYWVSRGYSSQKIASLESWAYSISLLGLLSIFLLCGNSRYSFHFSPVKTVLSSCLVVFTAALTLVFTIKTLPVILCLGLVLGSIAYLNSLIPILSLGAIEEAAASSGLNFSAEYGKYRKFGSIGFMLGLVLCGLFTDSLSAHVIPIILSLSGAMCGYFLFKANVKEPSLSKGTNKVLKNIIHLLPFFFIQLFVWAGFCIFFRYFTLRMREMGAGSFEISSTSMLLGLVALSSIRRVGHIVDKWNLTFLLFIVLVFTALRIFLISIPETNLIGFYLVQLLHIPTWVINDIVSVRYLKEQNAKLGALNISVINQFSVTLGMTFGSYFMSKILLITDLKTSFIYASIIPFFALPFLLSKHMRS